MTILFCMLVQMYTLVLKYKWQMFLKSHRIYTSVIPQIVLLIQEEIQNSKLKYSCKKNSFNAYFLILWFFFFKFLSLSFNLIYQYIRYSTVFVLVPYDVLRTNVHSLALYWVALRDDSCTKIKHYGARNSRLPTYVKTKKLRRESHSEMPANWVMYFCIRELSLLLY